MANRNTRRNLAIYRSRMVAEMKAGERSSWPVYKSMTRHKKGSQINGSGPSLTEQAVMYGSVREFYHNHKQKLLNKYAR